MSTQIELAGRAVIAQMHLGPWPVEAPAHVWRWLQAKGWVADICLTGGEDGWRLAGMGYSELERLGWIQRLTPAPEQPRGVSR